MRTLSVETMERVIAFIDRYHDRNGYTPTISEIALGLSLAVGTVHKYLHRMAENGMIELDGRHVITPNIARRRELSAPIAGEIACGAPVWVEETRVESLPLPAGFSDGEYFWLRARGSSMIGVGIDDGDYVLIRRQPTAGSGETVAALIENEATLKIFLPDPKRRKIVLRAANDDKTAYPDQIYDAILIRGVAVFVLKPLA
ncbi:MAG: repressor LexA [Clostridia bacterium]|nr:repressor LexA [Clostridia bacterium]